MASEVAEPTVAWSAHPAALDTSTGPIPAGGDGDAGDAVPSARPAETRAREGEQARADFHRAAARPAAATEGGARTVGRSQALQAFFLANTGRGLLPAGETSGVLSPNLKTEES